MNNTTTIENNDVNIKKNEGVVAQPLDLLYKNKQYDKILHIVKSYKSDSYIKCYYEVQIHFARGDYLDAIQSIEKFENGKRDVRFDNYLIYSLRKLQRYDEAIKIGQHYIDNGLSQGILYAKIYSNLAMVYLEIYDYKKAISSIKIALNIDPNRLFYQNIYNQAYKLEHSIWNQETLAGVTGGIWLNKPNSNSWRIAKSCLFDEEFAIGDLAFLRLDGERGLFSTINTINSREQEISGVVCDKKGVYKGSKPTLLVPDINCVLLQLAAYNRAKFKGKVIVCTGTSGKTTTTAMLQHVLNNYGIADRSIHNQNLLKGILWNLSYMRNDADFWIQEIASYSCSQGSFLTIPDIAVVTNIGAGHLDIHKTIEGVAQAKVKILSGVKKGGYAILNKDMDYYSIFEQEAISHGLNIITYGEHVSSMVRLLSYKNNEICFMIKQQVYKLPFYALGKHMGLNLCATMGVLMALGFPIMEEHFNYYSTFLPLNGRGVSTSLTYNGKQITIIDETFNANLVSMKASIESMANYFDKDMENVVILGDMLELGKESSNYHLQLIDSLSYLSPSRVLLLGEKMKYLWNKISNKYDGAWFKNIDDLLANIDTWIKNNDRILIKSSHGTGLYKLVNYFKTSNK